MLILKNNWGKILIALLVLGGGYFYFGRNGNKAEPATATAEIKNIEQIVSITGRVKPSNSVDLAFETAGKIISVSAEVGSRVDADQLLLRLDDSSLQAELAKAQADLEAYNTDNIRNKADADLASAYEAGITAAQKSSVIAKTSLFTLTDIQFAHYNLANSDSFNIAYAKAQAVEGLLGAPNIGNATNDTLSELSGGAFGLTQTAASTRSQSDIDIALSSLLNALGKVKNTLDRVPVTSTLTATEKTNLSAEKTNISAELTAIAGKIQAINVQKVTNENNISSSLASVKSAEANIKNIQVSIAKTALYSPISGIVSVQDAKVGQIVSPSVAIVSIISGAQFQIEADVPEADIAKLHAGQSAMVTLDAYGSGIFFDAKIVSINPSEKIIDGVATYKTTFQFLKKDKRVKTGMTANIDVSSAKKEKAVALPGRAIFTKEGKKYVLLVLGENKTEKREIQTGILGVDGSMEIISGLNAGDKVLIPQID